MAPEPAGAAAFYTVADERYFLGLVGLVNSLRLVGHREPIHVLDCGLSDAQRRQLEPEVTLTRDESGEPPWLLKTVLPVTRPAAVMALLDADLVATRSLAPLVELAGGGPLVAFRDSQDRFVPEWGPLLGDRPARRGPYLSSAALFASGSSGQEVLAALRDRSNLVEFELTHWRRRVPGYAFEFADQDLLNAILATEARPRPVEALAARLAPTPPFAGLRLHDAGTLRCAYGDGVEPYLIHHHVVKPWLEETHHGVYSRLLRRLLLGDDVAISVPERELPMRFRRGVRALAERGRINLRESFRFRVRDPLATRLRAGGDR